MNNPTPVDDFIEELVRERAKDFQEEAGAFSLHKGTFIENLGYATYGTFAALIRARARVLERPVTVWVTTEPALDHIIIGWAAT